MQKYHYILITLILSFCMSVARAAPLFKVTINPIQICSTDGLTCANSSQQLFEAEMDKIYAQASIDIVFNPFTQYNDSSYLSIAANDGTPSSADIFLNSIRPLQDPSPVVINMWFVQDLIISSGTLYGLGFLGGDGILISDAIFAANRIDTLAHELGHNLGISHHGPSNNLMSAGSGRTVPNSISDITTDGITGTSILSSSDLTTIQGSVFVVEADVIPSPLTLYLFIAGLFSLRFFKQS